MIFYIAISIYNEFSSFLKERFHFNTNLFGLYFKPKNYIITNKKSEPPKTLLLFTIIQYKTIFIIEYCCLQPPPEIIFKSNSI